MNTTVSLVVGVVMIIGIGGLVVWQTSGETASQPNTTQTNGDITAAEVAQHASGTDCWSSINGSVYDLTSWIPEHPGGSQAIVQLCGKDGSEKFNRQHGGATMQEQILAGFKIGTLTQ